jgi:hypothetical protein
MESLLRMKEGDPSFTRTFKVDYFRIAEHRWRAKSQLQDPVYNVVTTLDISVPDFIVQSPSVQFFNFPRKECLRASPKMKEFAGTNLRAEFRDVLRREFLGANGCDTIFNLLNLSARAFVFTYLAREVGPGGISIDQYRSFFPKGAGCVIDQREGGFRKSFFPMYCVPVNDQRENEPKPVKLETSETIAVEGRRVRVDYFEASDTLWRAESRLTDFEHNIIVTLDISTEDLIVRDANVIFLRQPFKECNWMQQRMQKIVGACFATDFREKVYTGFTGAEGCGNIYVLLNSINRGFIEFFLWRNTVMGRLTPEHSCLCADGLRRDCIAANP